MLPSLEIQLYQTALDDWESTRSSYRLGNFHQDNIADIDLDKPDECMRMFRYTYMDLSLIRGFLYLNKFGIADPLMYYFVGV